MLTGKLERRPDTFITGISPNSRPAPATPQKSDSPNNFLRDMTSSRTGGISSESE